MSKYSGRHRSLLGAATAFALVAASSVITVYEAQATPKMAKQTAMECAGCHQNPKGGKKLNDFGAQFKAAGNKLPAKPGDPPAAAPSP